MSKYVIEISPSHGPGCEFKDIVKATSIVDAFKKAKDIVCKLNNVNDKDNSFDVFSITVEEEIAKKVD